MYVTVSGAGKYRVIQFREDTRIPGTKKRKAHVVKTIGNYEKLLAENPNILEELKAEARELTAEKKASAAPIVLEVSSGEIRHEEDLTPAYYFGHSLILQLWKKLKLDTYFADHAGKREAQRVIDAILYLLIHRCGDPASILACANDQKLYAGIEEIGLHKLYDVLDVLE